MLNCWRWRLKANALQALQRNHHQVDGRDCVLPPVWSLIVTFRAWLDDYRQTLDEYEQYVLHHPDWLAEEMTEDELEMAFSQWLVESGRIPQAQG